MEDRIEVYIAPSDEKPHTAPDKDDKYKAYIRVADENILANEVLMQAWKKQKTKEGTLLKISKARRDPVFLARRASVYQHKAVLPYRPYQLLCGP